ncbi:histidinol-phosphatase HisJ [Mangrovibacillus cuniculi]|uniref:Histidinol-phosphatase n=1 Tax=Mangrovibacillus cuniculi TaxID=2593652 RepID=A0A7S8HFY9_9BACI|nr:histidinol-phosphatase HisJ [Mangrovibacillus cuniculi]QPC47242.1 histidinol-phosphatase HisJ [Mangrovibacillus cuniculi]
MKRDGHIHTPFCPHGSKESLTAYVEKAIRLGLERITFTEHAPLPTSFTDPTPLKDSAMTVADVPLYIKEVTALKDYYANKITIQCGFEVDYIEGLEEETKDFLNEYGMQIDDCILSVHFLKDKNQWFCLDYHEDTFHVMIQSFGSVERIYDTYYQSILASIHADLGSFKPKRLGHITLVHKFQELFPVSKEYKTKEKEWWGTILQETQKYNYQLDCNGAGIVKPYCKEVYPPISVIQQALSMQIPCVYGSDAHHPNGLAQGVTNELRELIRHF